MDINKWQAIADLMDDVIREEIHAELAPCTEEEFLQEYCRRHKEKFGEEFELSKDNPNW